MFLSVIYRLAFCVEHWTLDVERSTFKDKSANHHAYHRYLLSRRNFVVVFLRRAGVGGIEKALRGQSGISVEDRADG